MKKWFYVFLTSLFAFGMAACSDDPSIDNHPKEQLTQPANDKSANTNDDVVKEDESGNNSDDGNVRAMDEQKMMEEIPFTKFSLEIDYAPDMQYDFEYEENDNGASYRAELEDSVHDKKLKGKEAFQMLYTLMQDIHLDENTTKEEAMQQIFDTFQIDDNYTKFELDYVLKNGTKKEFEDRK